MDRDPSYFPSEGSEERQVKNVGEEKKNVLKLAFSIMLND